MRLAIEEIIKKNAPIHTRNISLSTFPYEQSGVVVHGILKDRRHLPIVDILGRPKLPGIVHHMTVTLAIAPEPLKIVRAEARMLTVPSDLCHHTLDRISGLEGLEVKPGFSNAVKSAVGGTEGCVHLCTLVKAMGTEIIHGWMTQKRHSREVGTSRTPSVERLKKEFRDRFYLIDSCRVWKKDGPRVRQMKEALESAEQKDGGQMPSSIPGTQR